MPSGRADLAEQCALAIALLDQKKAVELTITLRPTDFLSVQHQTVAEVIFKRVADGLQVDLVSVMNDLKMANKEHVLKSGITGHSYLTELVNLPYELRSFRDYLSTVKNSRVIRQLEADLTVIREKLKVATDPKEITAQLQEISQKASGDTCDPHQAPSLADHCNALLAKLKSGKVDVVPTGLGSLDVALGGGFKPTDLVLMGGRPGCGKSSLIMDILDNASVNHGCLFISLEMPVEQLAMRMVSVRTGIPVGAVIHKGLHKEIEAALETIKSRYLEINDKGAQSIADIYRACQAASRTFSARGKKLSLLAVDYIGLIKPSVNKFSEHERITESTRGLKFLAKELNIPVIALAQLNRSLEKRDNKRPLLSDLRESGSLEENADQVLMLYRDDYYAAQQKKPERNGILEIGIAKNRNGPSTTVELIFDEKTTSVRDKTCFSNNDF